MNEKAPEERRTSARVAAPLLSLMLMAGLATSCSKANSHESCASPIAESAAYPGDPTAQPDDQATWKTGVLVTTTLPPKSRGLVVAYRAPDETRWRDVSWPVDPGAAHKIALRIGHGAVVFNVQIYADQGSPACTEVPDSRFSQPQPFDALLAQESGPAAVPRWSR
jgi:hypothetical protein